LEALNLEIKSDINSISSAVYGVMQYLDDSCQDIKECLIFEIRVILNELLINSIIHGNKMDPKKKVFIRVRITGNNRFFAYIEDEGKGYNYNKYLNQKESPHKIAEIKETGRGMLITENLCDKIKFNSKGNKILVLKKI